MTPRRRRHRLAPLVLAVGLLAAACGQEAAQQVGHTGAVAPTATTEANPVTTVAGEDLQALVAGWRDAAGAPGVVVAVRYGDDEPILVAEGVSDLRSGVPLRPTASFRIGSITKVVTAAVLVQLASEGLVDLDEPVETYLPGWAGEFPEAGAITVRMLVDHTNGLIEYAWDPAFYAMAAGRLDEPIEPEEIVAFAAGSDPVFEPGGGYHYTTTTYLVAGRLIEEVTGSPAHEEIRRRVLEPLGMDDTVLPPGDRPTDVVHGYFDLDGRAGEEGAQLGALLESLIGRTQLPESGRLTDADGRRYDVLAAPQALLTSVAWTGGGLESTAADVSRLLRGVVGGSILDPAGVAEMTRPATATPYGMGISVAPIAGRDAVSHGGGVPGYRSVTAWFPGADVSITVLTNLVPVDPDVHELVAAIIEVVAP